mmetsp:Transcript_23761/g.68411  ORF Transcript_23761/g.68411 Transcript_23761/m.68411 type:complete len:408 (-) Transcript_23761:61-1284(-)
MGARLVVAALSADRLLLAKRVLQREHVHVSGRLTSDVALSVLRFVPLRYHVVWHNEGASMVASASGILHRLDERGAGVVGIRAFADDDRVLTWSRGGSAKLWDTSRGSLLHRFDHMGLICDATMSPEKSMVVTCTSSGRLVVWDAISGRSMLSIAVGLMRAVKMFPAGDRVIAWGLEKSAAVWHTSTGSRHCSLCGHADSIDAAEVFPHGDRVITGSRDLTAIIWDVVSCRALHKLEHLQWVRSVAVVLGGEEVVTLTDAGVATSWSARTGAPRRVFQEPSAWTADLFDSVVPFAGGRQMAAFNIRGFVTWNVSSGRSSIRGRSDPERTVGLAISPDGGLAATCGLGKLLVWDMNSGKVLHKFVERHPAISIGSVEPFSQCSVAFGVTPAFDPQGIGCGGATFRELL